MTLGRCTTDTCLPPPGDWTRTLHDGGQPRPIGTAFSRVHLTRRPREGASDVSGSDLSNLRQDHVVRVRSACEPGHGQCPEGGTVPGSRGRRSTHQLVEPTVRLTVAVLSHLVTLGLGLYREATFGEDNPDTTFFSMSR